MSDTDPGGRAPPAKQTLKQRFENHPIPFILGICAVVAAGMGSVATYVTRSAISVQEAALVEAHGAQLDTLRAGHATGMQALREEQADALKGRDAVIEALRASTFDLEAENITLRAVKAAFMCPDGEGCGSRFLESRIRPVPDEDGLMARENVIRIFDGKIFAPDFARDGVKHLALPYGAMHRFQLDPTFSLESAGDQYRALFRKYGEVVEHVWLLGPEATLEAHGRLKRFVPHFSVFRMATLSDVAETVATRPAWLDEGDSYEPVFAAFNNDLRERSRGEFYRKMRPQIRRVESIGDGALFAHFQTVLRDVVIDGEPMRRTFINEMIFYVPAGVGSTDVFVVRCAFLSDVRDAEKSGDWDRVMAWWSGLIIRAT